MNHIHQTLSHKTLLPYSFSFLFPPYFSSTIFNNYNISQSTKPPRHPFFSLPPPNANPMCQLSKETYSGCGHKAKTNCLSHCKSCNKDGDEYTCTDAENRKVFHRWIEGKCPRCAGVDSVREEEEEKEEEGSMEELIRAMQPPGVKWRI